ncbi:Uncharacterized conserved protein [Phaffia rhodozyma]|uniref:Uncharacterized conserved protein n=1 Tax=Phaffia rhodozyma TaxID=264483 RepID=A0A0F7SPD7_PHARH|nr:Uncharacterized conserved protein [Phaffia rhodozyma]
MANEEILPSVLSKSASSPEENFFIIFFSDYDEVKKNLWCPDCVEAIPLVESYQKSSPKHNLEIQYVGDRSSWRSSDSVFRKNPYNLTCIPTIIKYVNGKEVDRLPEPGLLNPTKFNSFVSSS